MTEQEFIDKNGDLWTVRECCGDHENCVAVERWWPPIEKDALAVAIDREVGGEEDDDEAPRPGYRQADDFHIPLESLGDLVDALRKYDRKAGALPQ